MKYLLLPGLLVFIFLKWFLMPAGTGERKVLQYKLSYALSCGGSPSDDATDTAANGKYISVLPGWGKYSYTVSTKNDSAQWYFNQGLNMYYSYHVLEARASFREAARLDSGAAMLWWGWALSLGPTYNFSHRYKINGSVVAEALRQMNRYRSSATEKEQALIEAMNLRYPADSTDTARKALNEAYAAGLKKVMMNYPDDADVTVLYIDAVMLMHSWDFWNNDGTAKPWTPEVVKLCETVLKNHPRHPAALHYYMHLTEASRHPEVALPAAALLVDMLPGVAHMVHMASHEYERNGLYADGVAVNDMADSNLLNYGALSPQLALGGHSMHYFGVQTFCALSAGMHDTGLRDALRLRGILSPKPSETVVQNLYMMPSLVRVRMGRWKEILEDTTTDHPEWPAASALYHFSKGMAFAYTGYHDSARHELMQLQTIARDPVLQVREIPFNVPARRITVGENILAAVIMFSEKQSSPAIAALTRAINIEDSLIYSEPKDWMLPARQYLGAYLLKLGRPVQAEKVYREDLIWNPGNGWSLLGLYQSLKAQGKSKSAAVYRKKYGEAFAHAETIPPASVYME
jgi:tetratricopeptide (TPR) repeat protein